MESQGWIPPNPADDGAFGKEVHARVATTIAQNNDGRWITNVYVASENHPTTPFRTILSIGQPPQGGTTGTTEIDVLRVKDGYNPQVGEVLNPQQLDDLFEIKTSVGGKINQAQKIKLKAVRGGLIKISMSERRWTSAAGWAKTPRVVKYIKLLGLLGLVATAYAFINLDSYDDDVDELIIKLDAVKAEPPDQKKVAAMLVMNDIRGYLNHFDPSNSVDIITLTAIYDMLGHDW